ncbi:hypothetical protein AJ88_24105 [Mesorhizobium amorphae CCBAU 01583]|nr:hypothetical protein AJ88_24105 [Mesorhizobium amorphae CCBAU 01583]
MALEQKTNLNQAQGDEAQKKAIVECRVEQARLTTWPTYTVNAVVIGFVIFVLVLGLMMIRPAAADPVYPTIKLAIWVFFIVFVALSLGLLWMGIRTARSVRTMLDG